MLFNFKTECPRCHNKSEIGVDRPQTPIVKCGNCLMNDVEVVDLICTPVKRKKPPARKQAAQVKGGSAQGGHR